jgi:hypothetical protein
VAYAAVAAILLSASDKKAKGCDFKQTYLPKKQAKGSKKGEEGQVDAAPPTIRPNSFGGQYSPFLPLATLGAAITIGDRSALSLGAMTVAGLVTAIQLNNAQADCGLNGLRKCREERAFDAAKTYLLVAVRATMAARTHSCVKKAARARLALCFASLTDVCVCCSSITSAS